MERQDFVLNNETVVNSHGFVVLNSGGKLERFKANPVMLLGHNDREVIGRWLNTRFDGVEMLAAPEYDEEDTDALKVKGKVERGYLKGASLGIIPLAAELRQMPNGEHVPFVTSWELLEASIVAIPSNSGAIVRLYSKDGKPLSDDQVKLSINSLIKPTKEMDKIVLTAEAYNALGVASTADASELSAAIVALQVRAEKAENQLTADRKAKAELLVDSAVKAGRLTADKRDSFVKLAIDDYAQAQSIISAIPGKKSLAAQVETKGEKGREEWEYMRWAKEDPKGLERMKAEHPEQFEQLRAAYKKAV